MMAMIGWLMFVIISGAFGAAAVFWTVVAAYTSDKTCLVGTVFFGLLSAAFGWAAWCNVPFKMVML